MTNLDSRLTNPTPSQVSLEKRLSCMLDHEEALWFASLTVPCTAGSSSPFVEPDDSPLSAEVVAAGYLKLRGVPADDADWLASWLVRPGFLPEPCPYCDGRPRVELDELNLSSIQGWCVQSLFCYARYFVAASVCRRDAAYLLTLSLLLGADPNSPSLHDSAEPQTRESKHEEAKGEESITFVIKWSVPWKVDEKLVLDFARQTAARGVDFARGVAMVAESDKAHFKIVDLARFLYTNNLVSIASVIDVARIVTHGANVAFDPNTRDHPRNLSCLPFWISHFGPEVMPALAPSLDGLDAGGKMALSRYVCECAENYIHGRGLPPHHVPRPGTAAWHLGVQLSEWLWPYFEALTVEIRQGNADRKLTLLWLSFGWRLALHLPDRIDDELRRLIANTAMQYWGKLRPLLRESHLNGEASAKQLSDDRWYLTDAVFAIAATNGTCSAVKALLLAMRSLSVPAVASDLRYWFETDFAPPPEPFFHIPYLAAEVQHAFLGLEQSQDPSLNGFLTNFADFCLERLASRQKNAGKPLTNEEMVDPSPIWRCCWIRAVRELGVNPGGRGHRTLSWSSTNDPDTSVREAATVAYEEMRHITNENRTDRSPRASSFAAIWWLRQAHLRALGIELEAHGAQRTRAKEIRRTKDNERAQSVT